MAERTIGSIGSPEDSMELYEAFQGCKSAKGVAHTYIFAKNKEEADTVAKAWGMRNGKEHYSEVEIKILTTLNHSIRQSDGGGPLVLVGPSLEINDTSMGATRGK